MVLTQERSGKECEHSLVDSVLAGPALTFHTGHCIVYVHSHSRHHCVYDYSADMLEDIQVPWVILGHSERRSLLNESEDVSSSFLPAPTSCALLCLSHDMQSH